MSGEARANAQYKVAPVASRTSIPRPYSNWKVPPQYEIKSLLGVGSYGHVCEAFDTKRNRSVAVKRIPKAFDELIDCKRILREIAILSRISNNNVVGLLDVWIPGDPSKFDELYLVLELADCDLKKLIKTPVFLSDLHINTLLYGLLLGIKYIHSKGIYHRDLKPANCLVNQNCCVKICDFGLARTVEAPSDPTRLPGVYDDDDDDLTGVMHNRKMKRQLTSHVVTRWYRAPELILLQENYTQAIDIWSAGCIYAELLGMMKENSKSHLDRGPLFPGSCCFPLSPDQKQTDHKFCSKGNRDQLNMIFEILGTPSEEDIQSLGKDDARKYVRLFPKRSGTDLRHKFPGAPSASLSLLKKMLTFNPSKRLTVDEALESPLFRDLRSKSAEMGFENATPVELPFDDWKNMDENELRFAFLKEAKKFNPSIVIPRELEMVGYKKSTQ